MRVGLKSIGNWVIYITHNNVKVLNYQLISNNWCKCNWFQQILSQNHHTFAHNCLILMQINIIIYWNTLYLRLKSLGEWKASSQIGISFLCMTEENKYSKLIGWLLLDRILGSGFLQWEYKVKIVLFMDVVVLGKKLNTNS